MCQRVVSTIPNLDSARFHEINRKHLRTLTFMPMQHPVYQFFIQIRHFGGSPNRGLVLSATVT
jgi:hypothetical protein